MSTRECLYGLLHLPPVLGLTPSPDMVNLFHFDLTEQGLSPKTCSNYVAHTISKRAVGIWLKCLLVWSLFTINNFSASRSPTYLGGPDTHRKKKPRTSDILEIFSKFSIILSLQDRSRHCFPVKLYKFVPLIMITLQFLYSNLRTRVKH